MLTKIRNIFSGRIGKGPERLADIPEVSLFEDTSVEIGISKIREPDHKKGNIDHESHMRVIAKDYEDASKICFENINSALMKKTVMYGDDSLSGYVGSQGLLKVLSITMNGNPLTAYPVFNAGNPAFARITGVTECQSTYEGQVEAYMSGSTLTFFDVLYFRNKHRYTPGKDVNVVISGIAYVLTKARTAQGKKKGAKHRIVGEPQLLIRYENGDIDDYVFRGIVEEVREFEVYGMKAQAIKTSFLAGTEGNPIDIYICATRNSINEKISPGDHISGIIWLQGFAIF